MKTCHRCRDSKPISEFSIARLNRKDGLSYWCRSCLSEYVRGRRAVNRERISIVKRAWRDKHPPTDADRAKERARHARTRAARRRSSRLNYLKHRDARLAYMKAWRAANPVKRRNHAATDNSRRRGARRHDSIDLASVFDRQAGLCAYCRGPLPEKWHLDHRTPLSRGGEHTPENVCAACPPCNVRKAANTAEEYEERLRLEGDYHGQPEMWHDATI